MVGESTVTRKVCTFFLWSPCSWITCRNRKGLKFGQLRNTLAKPITRGGEVGGGLALQCIW